MIKKIFSIIGVTSLICFSFYYTGSAANIIKRNDPIMKKIINEKIKYIENPKNAILVNNNIIPGISGKEVDIDKSYSMMKDYGSFNEELLVFKELIPVVTITKIYDKYITYGNTEKNNVSIVIVIDNEKNLDKLLNILNEKNISVSFFINNSLIEENNGMLEKLNNHEINSLETTDGKLINAKKILKRKINKDIKFCYLEKEDSQVLNTCKNNNMYTIIPSIITYEFPYSDIKNNIKNGSIIKFENSIKIVKELKYIINYIEQKGYKIVTLSELIKE